MVSKRTEEFIFEFCSARWTNYVENLAIQPGWKIKSKLLRIINLDCFINTPVTFVHRYGGVPTSTSNDPRPSYAPDEDLIDFEPAPSRGPPPASNRRVYSPVNSDHPSDLTEGTWDSRAGLIG